MKNITLSADETLIEAARKAAARRGQSLNSVIRAYLGELAGAPPVASEFERLQQLSRMAHGRRRGWRFDRSEVHERS